MAEEKNFPQDSDKKKLLDLKEAKENLLTLEGLLRMRQKKQNPKNKSDDGTKKDEDFDIDPIPGYGGTW